MGDCMTTNVVSAASIIIFALLVFAGGIMGFVKGKSKASLIAGISQYRIITLVC